ncbi:OsmC family peroxiredoxin [Dokdonia sinensis]|uniref:OsmC family peroxiredoxin n=1 Tax=Dokdonia sinensis TaxID=2479847 RepID=A0A3M0GEQ2_9FLAO|nr:OsmC family protein [Dokdonia sinensis]RMB63395.1 OsmC family peroxiredoxin [Dokdonia sinensis]
MAQHIVTTVYKQGMQFETDSPTGYKALIDTSPENGGNNEGLGPKGMMLSALAGCTGLDIVFVLNKMRADIPKFEMVVKGELTEEHPKTYHTVHLDYHFYGEDLKKDKIQKAVDLSAEQYCGVMEMFRQFCDLKIGVHFHESET